MASKFAPSHFPHTRIICLSQLSELSQLIFTVDSDSLLSSYEWVGVEYIQCLYVIARAGVKLWDKFHSL